MQDETAKVEVEQLKNAIELLYTSMDDYLFLHDFTNDYGYIAPNALERFNIPTSEHNNVLENAEKTIYPGDVKAFMRDVQQLMNGEKDIQDADYRMLDKKGNPVWVNSKGYVIRGSDGKPQLLIGCINEIGKKQIADNVSGLLGEVGLQRETVRHSLDCEFGFVMRLGIDNFKEINENRGLDYGDMILRKTAECIETVISPKQKLYRVVADEFVIFDFETADVKEARKLYKKIRRAIDNFIENNFYEVFFTVSAGLLDLSAIEEKNYSNLMKLSEFALNEAKMRGRNRYYFFDQDDYDRFCRKRDLIQVMRRSVNHGCKGFETYFQPIVDMKTGKMSGAEALLRFHSDYFGDVTPYEFIPLLEETGLIIPVGKWVLYQAMKACDEIQKTIPEFSVSVNLSYIQVLKSNVLDEILNGVEKYHFHPGSIIIELTESGFIESNDTFVEFCDRLQKNGVMLALDDFGTGYSNFHYLYNLNPNSIKIDRDFTYKALHSDYERNLLKHIIEMAHGIHLKLCIEGIETKEELNKIREIEPDFIQGYYFGKPCNFENFKEQFVNETAKKG